MWRACHMLWGVLVGAQPTNCNKVGTWWLLYEIAGWHMSMIERIGHVLTRSSIMGNNATHGLYLIKIDMTTKFHLAWTPQLSLLSTHYLRHQDSRIYREMQFAKQVWVVVYHLGLVEEPKGLEWLDEEMTSKYKSLLSTKTDSRQHMSITEHIDQVQAGW